MSLNPFEEFASLFFEEQGYFSIKNIRYGKGRGKNEIDFLGYNPKNGKKIHVEITEHPCTLNEIKKKIKTKFQNQYLDDIYQKYYGSINDIDKIFLVWWWYNDSQYKRKIEIEENYNLEIISHEKIYEFFIKRNEEMWDEIAGDTNKISHLLDLLLIYQQKIRDKK